LAVCILLVDRSDTTGSTVGAFLRNPTGNPFAAPPYPVRIMTSNSLALYEPRPGEFSRSSPFADPAYNGTPGATVFLAYQKWSMDSGFWAACRHEEHATIESQTIDTATVPEEKLSRARAAMVTDLVEQRLIGSDEAHRIAQGVWHSTNIRWPGVLHNSATLACLIMLVGSVAWIGRWINARTRASRMAAGICPRCQYPLAGTSGKVCPECGETIQREQSAPEGS
jgi:hypothetical protein